MFEVGRLCVKIAGRDAGLKCLVVESIDDTFVMIDGQTRRRKVNIKHLEPLDKVLSIEKNASHEDIVEVLSKAGIKVEEKKQKERKSKDKEEKPAKKAPEKAEPKKSVKKASKKTE